MEMLPGRDGSGRICVLGGGGHGTGAGGCIQVGWVHTQPQRPSWMRKGEMSSCLRCQFMLAGRQRVSDKPGATFAKGFGWFLAGTWAGLGLMCDPACVHEWCISVCVCPMHACIDTADLNLILDRGIVHAVYPSPRPVPMDSVLSPSQHRLHASAALSVVICPRRRVLAQACIGTSAYWHRHVLEQA